MAEDNRLFVDAVLPATAQALPFQVLAQDTDDERAMIDSTSCARTNWLA